MKYFPAAKLRFLRVKDVINNTVFSINITVAGMELCCYRKLLYQRPKKTQVGNYGN